MYSDRDEELNAVTVRRLIDSGLTLASAESCTGGMFAASLTSCPGVSAAYKRGYITYSNESKTDELGVPASLIEEKGAVSEEVAAAMATGARKAAHTDIGIAVTGVAGPDGGSESKPVGLSWIAIADRDGVTTRRCMGRDKGRNVNRQIAVLAMLNILRKHLR
jgi:nicotinamide-nucleotide amidase